GPEGVEVDTCPLELVQLPNASVLPALARRIVEPGLACYGKIELLGEFRRDHGIPASAGVHDEAERALAVDGHHDVGLAVRHFHVGGVGLAEQIEVLRMEGPRYGDH